MDAKTLHAKLIWICLNHPSVVSIHLRKAYLLTIVTLWIHFHLLLSREKSQEAMWVHPGFSIQYFSKKKLFSRLLGSFSSADKGRTRCWKTQEEGRKRKAEKKEGGRKNEGSSRENGEEATARVWADEEENSPGSTKNCQARRVYEGLFSIHWSIV